MIGVIDYGMGNLRSVLNAFEAVGAPARRVTDAAALHQVDAIVLPGVGAFGDGIASLHQRGFVPVLEQEVLKNRKPFLGICLGLQLLATRGLEHGDFKGLNWIAGTVDRLQVPAALRIPHIGWNDVRFVKRDSIFSDMGEAQSFYFVHSFSLRPEDPSVVTGWVDYGGEWVAGVEKDNIAATQFHPEKSHRAGLRLLKNWCAKLVPC